MNTQRVGGYEREVYLVVCKILKKALSRALAFYWYVELHICKVCRMSIPLTHHSIGYWIQSQKISDTFFRLGTRKWSSTCQVFYRLPVTGPFHFEILLRNQYYSSCSRPRSLSPCFSSLFICPVHFVVTSTVNPSHPSQASSSRQPKQSVTIGGEIAVLSVLSWGPTLIEYLDPVASFRY